MGYCFMFMQQDWYLMQRDFCENFLMIRTQLVIRINISMISRASNKIIKNICDTRESLYLPSKFGIHCCNKTVVYIFASSLVSSITLCYGFTVLTYFSYGYKLVQYVYLKSENCYLKIFIKICVDKRYIKIHKIQFKN